jgi:maltose-binding protein MalE
MAGFADAGQYGVPMPAIPAMGTVWDAWGNAGLLMAQGELEPAEALGDAATQIRTLISESAK